MYATRAETEILASLPFQVLLFFNFNYSAAYGVALIYLTYIKCTTWAVHDLPRVMHFFFLSLWCCGEVMRLYFGYYGNLQEKVPHLAAFVLLTVFPAIPSTVYFASLQPLLRPFDQISSIFMLAGLVSFAGSLLARRRCRRRHILLLVNNTHPSPSLSTFPSYPSFLRFFSNSRAEMNATGR